MSEQFKDTGFLLRNLMDNMADNIYFKDRQSRFIMVNQAAADWQQLGSPEEIIGKSDFDNYREEDARIMFEAEQRIMETGEPLLGIEEHETWKDGHAAWVSTSKMPLCNDVGEIVGIFGISRDITAHKEAKLRTARYVQEIQRIKDEMEDELHMAGELQKAFFPTSYPVFAAAAPDESCIQFHHYNRFSGLVSGDFCSIRRISDTAAGLFLCDVMGHGVRAALCTAFIRALVEELAPLEKDPGRYLARMNELLLPMLRQEDVFLYATACYMTVDVSSGRIRFANAGHPVPVHLNPVSGEVKWMLDDFSRRGPALAMLDAPEYEAFEYRIDPGETVMMFTDGLLKAPDTHNEEFGEAGLIRAARKHVERSLQNLFSALEDEACSYAATGEFTGDVCLLGFKLKELLPSSTC